MILYYIRSGIEIKELKAPKKGCWIHVFNPSDEEISELRKLVYLSDEFVSSAKDIDEISQLEKRKDGLLGIIRVPVQKTPKQDIDLVYTTRPLGFVLSKKYFVTLSFFENAVVDAFLKETGKKSGIFGLLGLLLSTAKIYLRCLKKIGAELYSTQEHLVKSTENKEILQLLELEKTLIYFGTALKSNDLVVERLVRYKDLFYNEQHKELLEDFIIESRQAMSTNKIYGIVISEMMSAFSSIIDNNLNKVIKTLTGITIILMLPTLVSSIYGMNVPLPFQNSPFAFLIILAFSILLTIIGMGFFWNKRFF